MFCYYPALVKTGCWGARSSGISHSVEFIPLLIHHTLIKQGSGKSLLLAKVSYYSCIGEFKTSALDLNTTLECFGGKFCN